MTITLRIEHTVSDFDSWKAAFDSDPIGRQKSGVRRYHILRPTDDPNYVMINLEFDDLKKPRTLGQNYETYGVVRKHRKSCSENFKVRIVEQMETKEY
jgi:hypothetical protein